MIIHVHEYLRVVDGLVQGPAVKHPNLLVLAGGVGIGQVHSSKVVTTDQNLVTSSSSSTWIINISSPFLALSEFKAKKGNLKVRSVK